MPLLNAFLWRFGWSLLVPLANARINWLTWCNPRTGLAGTHAEVDQRGRCKECRRRVL